MASDLLDQLGGLGTVGLCVAVFLLAYGETAILMDLVVPGEVGLVIAGAAAASGNHPVAVVITAGALGAIAGDTTSYVVGRHWGRALIERFGPTRRRLGPLVRRSEKYFDRHGGRTVFFGRWIGALRAVVPFVAGLGRLGFATFLAWNVAASVLWAGVTVSVGAAFGESIAGAVDSVETALSVVVIVAVIGFFWWRRRAARRH